MKAQSNIDRLRVASPCPISWEQMSGDERVRFCDHCQLNVYNLAELSRIEVETLIAATEGRLCGRLYRRADGTVLTKDCPVGLRALRMRVSKRAAAVFAAVAGISSLVLGQQSSTKDGKTVCTPQARISRTTIKSGLPGDGLSGTVVDPNGVVITGASITITNLDSKKTDKTTSRDDGNFEFKSVTAGNYSIQIELPGFKSLQLRNLSVEEDNLTHLDLILEPASVTVTVGLLVAQPDLIDTPSGTTIINERMIRRFPIQ